MIFLRGAPPADLMQALLEQKCSLNRKWMMIVLNCGDANYSYNVSLARSDRLAKTKSSRAKKSCGKEAEIIRAVEDIKN